MGFADRLRDSLSPVWQGIPGRVGFTAWDLDERELVSCGADREMDAASTIKVLIMIAALREVRDGRLGLDTEVPLPVERAGGFGVLRELSSVHSLAMGDLLALMIVVSDNAATNALIDIVGFAPIAACAQDLGATSTRVERRLMDFWAPGCNVTTALDQARILDALATGRALPVELTSYALGVLSRQQVRDRLPALLGQDVDCWNKTGELLGVRHDVGLIGIGRPRAVVAVLIDELTDERSVTDARGGPASGSIAELGSAVQQALA